MAYSRLLMMMTMMMMTIMMMMVMMIMMMVMMMMMMMMLMCGCAGNLHARQAHRPAATVRNETEHEEH